MADKDVMAVIRQHEADRGKVIYEAMQAATEEGAYPGTVALAAGIEALIGELRDTAKLYDRAQLRGGKSIAGTLRTTASVLDPIVDQLRRGIGPARPAPRGGPSLPAEWCGESHEHGPHDWQANVGTAGHVARHCTGHHERDLSGLDALIAERSGTEAYLRGQADDIPGSQPLGPGSVKGAPELDNPFASDEGAGTVTGPAMAHEPQSAGDLFDDPAPVGWSNSHTDAAGFRVTGAPIPQMFDDPAPRFGSWGRKVSWGDLRDLLGKDRRGAGLPEHLSHSQMDTIEECGLKYVMQRDELLGVVEVPQWALIGGNAFHAAVEWFERMAAEVGHLQHVKDRLQVFRDEHGGRDQTHAEALWSWAFGQLITETALKSPVAQEHWRASKQGAEGYTFWLINGGDMVQRYLDARLAEIGGQGWRSIRRTFAEGPNAKLQPMIEWEYMTDVDGVPFKGVIDQVWTVTQQHGEMREGDLLIDDCKSGAKVGPDTRQLGEYALWLLREIEPGGAGTSVRIWGRYYDARRGTWTEPVDLLATHSKIELEVRAAGADLKKQHGMFTPNRSNFCGGCSVKHACPIFSTAP